MFLPAYGTHGLNAARPLLAAQLGLPTDDARMALLMAVFPVAAVAGYGWFGRYGDRAGLKRALLLGVGLFTVAHALLPVSALPRVGLALPPWASFVGLRALAGLAGGGITVAANGLGAALYPPERRGRSLSLVWLGVPLALVIGAPLPAWLAGPWQRLPPALRPWLGEPYAFVAVVAGAALLCLLPRAIPDLVATRRDGGPAPAPPWRPTAFALAAALLMPASVFTLIAASAPYTGAAFGFTSAEQGNLFLLLGLASVAGGVLSGAIADRVGRRRCLLASLALFGAGVLVLPACGRVAFVGVAAALGFVSTVRQGPFQALVSCLAAGGSLGRLSARVLTFSQVGIGLGQFVGSELQGGAGIGRVAVGSALASFAACACALRFREPPPRARPS